MPNFGVIGATILGIFTIQPAAAERAVRTGGIPQVRTATVQVADLDLAREPGARVLYDRIRYAARSLCIAEESSADNKRVARRRRCVESAVNAAVDQANAPLVTAVHLQRSAQLARL